MKWLWFAATLCLISCSKPESAATTAPPAASAPVDPPSYFKVDPATAASLTGEIRYKGPSEKAIFIDMDQDPECSKLYKDGKRQDEFLVVGKNGALSNTFVYLKAGLEGKAFAPSSTPVTIDQRGCWFQPRVIGLQTGQLLEVTNSDPVTHNIHPQPKANREWNQSQPPGDQPIRRRFAQPEWLIPVRCNVHKWMRAWIGVVPHPYFFVTGADGRFAMPNLPPGTYTIVAWHEKLGSQEQIVNVSASSSAKLDFQFNATVK